RWRVRDNMPGTPEYCPMVEFTPAVSEAVNYSVEQGVQNLEREYGKDIVWLSMSQLGHVNTNENIYSNDREADHREADHRATDQRELDDVELDDVELDDVELDDHEADASRVTRLERFANLTELYAGHVPSTLDELSLWNLQSLLLGSNLAM